MESQWFLELLECIRKESDSKKKIWVVKRKIDFTYAVSKKSSVLSHSFKTQ